MGVLPEQHQARSGSSNNTEDHRLPPVMRPPARFAGQTQFELADVYRIASRILPYIPPSLAYALCDQLGILGPLTPAWSNILANLEQVVPNAPDWQHAHYARRVVSGLLKNYYDLLRSHAVSSAALARTVDVVGIGNLSAALARGKGVIVVMPHMGNLSLVAETVALKVQSRIHVVVEQMTDSAVHTIINTLRRRGNIVPIEIGPRVVRPLMHALRAGEIVVLVSDRTVAAATVTVPFFGAPAVVPAGPATLALRTGAPLLTAFTYRQVSNRSTVVIDPPLQVEAQGVTDADVHHIMTAIMRIFAAYIRRQPGQWLLTERVWATA